MGHEVGRLYGVAGKEVVQLWQVASSETEKGGGGGSG